MRWQERCSRGEVGDPSRSHAEGLESRVALEEARATIASLFGARPREVVLCSGASEAIAMASVGAASRGAHTVSSPVEHAAVRSWAHRGDVTEVAVDSSGRVGVDDVVAALRPDTSIVHLQWANHEVGSLQPVAAVAEACRQRRILLHVDAAQAAGRVAIDFAAVGADLMSISAHKFGGPAGVGALLIRRGLHVEPLVVGGDQERGRRAGMENIGGVLGFAAAALEVRDTLGTEEARCRALSAAVIDWADHTDGVAVLGSRSERAPHIVCLRLDGVEPQPVVIGLDRAGIAADSGNSCSSESLEPSPVLQAMGADAAHSLRVSFGWNSTTDDVDRLLGELPRVLAELRSLRS